MNPEQVVFLVSFVCITVVVATVLLALQSLRRVSEDADRPDPHRRARIVADEPPAASLSGRLDQSFDWLVLESGLGIAPQVMFLGLIACGLLTGGSILVVWDTIPGGLVGMGLGLLLPIGVLMWHRERRMRQMRDQIPHVTDLLARAIRAGESVDQAIAVTGRELGGPLGAELARASHQLELGLSVAAVVRRLAARNRLVELRMLASTLMVHRQTGGNLADALDRLTGVIQDRMDYRRQMRAATGAGRSSALLIATISPVVYVLMFAWQPDHFRIMFEQPLGHSMLMTALVLEILGVLWVVRLLRTD